MAMGVPSRVTSRIEELGREARNTAFAERIEAAHRGPSVWQQIEDIVYEYPLRTLLVGIGVGLLIGAAAIRR